MANYLINDTQLTSVADAIRAKSGGSAGLAFPSGFISEIGNISNGGGGGSSEDAIIARTISGSYENATVESLGKYALASCSSLTTVSFLAATSIGANAFYNCANLTTVSFPLVTSIGTNAFQNCINLTTAIFGHQSSVVSAGSNIFYNANNVIIYVPDDLVESYKTAANWSQYDSHIKGISELPT